MGKYSHLIMNPKVKPATPQGRLELLETCIRFEDGNVLAGLRLYTGESTNAMCRRLGVNPSTARGCLGRIYGRRYETTRRALETGLGLPAYAMDTILKGGGE